MRPDLLSSVLDFKKKYVSLIENDLSSFMKISLFSLFAVSYIALLGSCGFYQTDEEMNNEREIAVRNNKWAADPAYKLGLNAALTDYKTNPVGKLAQHIKNQGLEGNTAIAYTEGYNQGLKSAAAISRIKTAL